MQEAIPLLMWGMEWGGGEGGTGQCGAWAAELGAPHTGADIWGLGGGKCNKSDGGLLLQLGLMGCQSRQGCLYLLIPRAWGTIHLVLTLF